MYPESLKNLIESFKILPGIGEKTAERLAFYLINEDKEKTDFFSGQYHVINGLISPLDGIEPDDIGIEKLIKRIQKNNFKEIIIAVKPSIEGETTALYIKKIIDGMNIKVTRIASGIPIGTDIEYIDTITLERALNDRKEIE